MADYSRDKTSNPVLAQAQKSIADINSKMSSEVNELQKRIYNINHNERFNDKEKLEFTKDKKIKVERAFLEMEDVIRRARFDVAQEFHRIRAANPNVPVEQHPQLKALIEMRDNLQRLATDIKDQHNLSQTYVPTIDPTMAQLQSTFAPTATPVMNKKQEAAFVKTATQHRPDSPKGEAWKRAAKDMENYAKENKVRVKDVKSQVVDALIDQKFEQVFGKKGRDMSREPTPPEALNKKPMKKSRTVDALIDERFEKVFGTKARDMSDQPTVKPNKFKK